jgi:hypothetical protein
MPAKRLADREQANSTEPDASVDPPPPPLLDGAGGTGAGGRGDRKLGEYSARTHRPQQPAVTAETTEVRPAWMSATQAIPPAWVAQDPPADAMPSTADRPLGSANVNCTDVASAEP